jgi:hypothetical protein
MAMSLEEMYKLAMNPKVYPDQRLLAIMQGHDTSLPMAVAMSAKQMRDKQEIAAKGAQAQAQAGTPSVRDQMLAKSAPQAGIDKLRAPTMESMGEEGMAGGGIVSFGIGGFNDPDDQDDPEQDEQDELDAMVAQHGDLGGLGAGIMAVASPVVASPVVAKHSSFSLKAPSGKDSNTPNILLSAAEKHNLPKELLARIAQAESGGKSTATNPRSSAKGLFQFTDRTWKSMGGKEGEQFDPEKNADLGAAFTRQNAEGLKRALGRNPTYGEVYGAHHFGLTGIKGLLNKNPDMPIDRVVSRQVISSNPYLKGKTVGDTLAFLNNKAGDGIVSLAQGGIVGLKGGSKDAVKTDDTADTDDDAAMYGEFGAPDYYQLAGKGKAKGMSQGDIRAQEAQMHPTASYMGENNQKAPPAVNQGMLDKWKQQDALQQVVNANTGAGAGATPPAGPATPTAAPVDPFAASQSRLDKYLANLEDQHKQNQGLGMLMTGLTTAGTAGPLSSALAKGTQTGIGYVGDAQKGYNAATAQGLGAQAALDRNRVYSEMYGNKGQRDLDTKYSGLLQKYNATINKEIADNAFLKSNAVEADKHRKKRLGEMTTEDPGFLEWFTSKGGSLGPQSIQLNTVPGGNVIGAIKPK